MNVIHRGFLYAFIISLIWVSMWMSSVVDNPLQDPTCSLGWLEFRLLEMRAVMTLWTICKELKRGLWVGSCLRSFLSPVYVSIIVVFPKLSEIFHWESIYLRLALHYCNFFCIYYKVFTWCFRFLHRGVSFESIFLLGSGKSMRLRTSLLQLQTFRRCNLRKSLKR